VLLGLFFLLNSGVSELFGLVNSGLLSLFSTR
jgi:hypothetical protein